MVLKSVEDTRKEMAKSLEDTEKKMVIWTKEQGYIPWEDRKGVLEKVEKYIKLLLEKEKRIYQVILIGSLVNWNFKKSSDIDLALYYKPSFKNVKDAMTFSIGLEQEMEGEREKLGIVRLIDLRPEEALTWGYRKNYRNYNRTGLIEEGIRVMKKGGKE